VYAFKKYLKKEIERILNDMPKDEYSIEKKKHELYINSIMKLSNNTLNESLVTEEFVKNI